MNISQETPILIRGLSRSGGTLFVTIMDAHPDVSMSYELYPNLLDSLIQNPSQVDFFRKMLKSDKLIAKTYTGNQKNLKTFVSRSFRSGLSRMELADIFEKFLSRNTSPFSTEKDALEFIAECAKKKMHKEGKTRWGMKCSSSYERYLEVWPNAIFFNIVRDGRDILSSQLLTGSFNKAISKIAEGYVNSHNKFDTFIQKEAFYGMNVQYERLVEDDKAVLKSMCKFSNLTFSDEMMKYYEKDLTLFKNNSGHLSSERVSKPIDATQIGRWKSDLAEEQVNEFILIAGDVLKRFNYF